MLLNFRMPDVVILEKAPSTSGRFMLFYGIHYEAGITCHVVGTSDKHTGEVIMRHYNEKIEGCFDPKRVSSAYWEEFKNKMTERKPHGSYEEDDQTTELESLFDRTAHQRPRKLPTITRMRRD